MSGIDSQRGFIYQTIVAMIDCLERNDWDAVKIEPLTMDEKVDIHLYKKGMILSAIQVKSSKNAFQRSDVDRWLKAVKADAAAAKEVHLYLVGDKYTPACENYIKFSPEIRTFPFSSLRENCKRKLESYIYDNEPSKQVGDEDLQLIYHNVFSEFHNNSIEEEPINREIFRKFFRRLLSIPKCLTSIPAVNHTVGLVGREDILKAVRNRLDKVGCAVLVSGLGGIGKTAVMRWICEEIRTDGNDRNHVAWISCGDNLKEDLLMLREAFGAYKDEEDEAAYKRIINKLKTFDRILYLFMDNMARIPDEDELSLLNSFTNVRLMITSRHEIGDIIPVELGVLEKEPAADMFYRYYERDTERRYYDIALRIIAAVNYYTLLVELLAKAAKMSGGTLDVFNKKLEGKGFFDVFKRKIKTKHDEDLTIEESIIKLYEISGLSNEQQRIMQLFSIFTPEKEIYYEISDWAGFDEEALEELIQLGWLNRGVSEGGYVVHQIIRDSLERQLTKNGHELDLGAYGDLLDKVMDIEGYLPQSLEYARIRERIVLTEDIARYLSSSFKDRTAQRELLVKIARLFNDIACVYTYQGEYAKALKYSEDALAIREEVYGTDHLYTALTYNNIACVYLYRGDYDKALMYHEKALAIYEKLHREGYLDAAIAYNNIALVYHRRGEYEKALGFYRKALAIREKFLGTEHPDTAITYNGIACVLREHGDYEKALRYYGKALATQEKILGTEHPDTALIYGNIALVYEDQGNYEKALRYYEKDLAICKKILGAEHPSTATTYNNIAILYEDLGDYEKALEYNKKALDIREKVLGIEHPDTMTTCSNIALVYEDQGNYEKALEYNRKVLAIREKVLGIWHPDTATTYNNIAGVLRDQGDYEKALEYYWRALAIREKVQGIWHPDTAKIYNNIGLVCCDQGDYEKALKYYEKDLAICKKVLGAEHLSVAKSYNNVALAYEGLSDYENALEYYMKALVIYEKVLGIEHPDTATIYSNIAIVYEDLGNYEKALEYNKKAFDIRENVLGIEHPDTALTYNNIALVYYFQGDSEKAREYYEKALRILERVLGENHPRTKLAQENLEILKGL